MQGLLDKTEALGAATESPVALRAAAGGNDSRRACMRSDKISRSEERGFCCERTARAAGQDLYRDYTWNGTDTRSR